MTCYLQFLGEKMKAWEWIPLRPRKGKGTTQRKVLWEEKFKNPCIFQASKEMVLMNTLLQLALKTDDCRVLGHQWWAHTTLPSRNPAGIGDPWDGDSISFNSPSPRPSTEPGKECILMNEWTIRITKWLTECSYLNWTSNWLVVL